MNVPDKRAGIQEAKKIIDSLRTQGKKIVFTNGCFDILHPGHVILLSRAKEEGDFLVIGLNSDSSVKKIKGNNRPVLNEDERALILSSLTQVDLVVLFDEETPLKLIKILAPDVLVKGDEYPLNSIVGAREVLSSGGKVERVRMQNGYSTTDLIERIVRKFCKKSPLKTG